MKKFLREVVNGILAGIMIIIGCSVFLACKATNNVAGAVLFSVALITICVRGYSLYTGKIGFMIDKHDKDAFSVLLTGLLGNVIATAAFGFLLNATVPALADVAKTLVEGKLANIDLFSAFVRGCFCGVLMYIAVAVYKQRNSVVGIVFCIPVFILAGFEHSVADMGYFAIGGVASFDAFLFILMVILGNTVGALLFPALSLIGKEKTDEKTNG